MSKILEIKDLSVGYNKIPVINNIEIDVNKGDIITIEGLNGSGKTTLLKTIMGLVKNIEGNIFFDEVAINDFNLKNRKQKGIDLAPEGRKIFPNLTVNENLIMGMAVSKVGKKEQKKRLKEIYNLFPLLNKRKKQLGGTLSGGEQQILSIARALMSKPKLLLLDEPTLGISPVILNEITGLIDKISKTGVSFIIADQKVDIFYDLKPKMYYISASKIYLR